MQKNTDINVLSAPNILTSDNQKAEIVVGQRVSVPTQATRDITSGNVVSSFTTEQVGLELYVTPQINDGDEVTLEIEQKIEDLTTKNQKEIAQYGIQTNQRRAKTTVVAQNGQTIVIGGLIQDKDTKTKTKVPLLGDIPIVGNLFKQTTASTEKVNLMVFITPSILRDPKDMTRMSVQKNTQRQRFNKSNGAPENKGLYKYGFDETLNMEAPSQTNVADTPAVKKRFDYQDQELAGNQQKSDDGDDSNNQVRQRVNSADMKTSDRSSVRPRQASTTTSSESNPFADVKPQ